MTGPADAPLRTSGLDAPLRTSGPGAPLRASGPVALIGAGPAPAAALAACLSRAVAVVAADGGAAAAIAAGRMPDRVIGDLDSLAPGTVPPERVVRVAGQDDTDLEKCLSRIDAPLVLGAGFLGGRVDHSLAAMNVLARRGAAGAAPCVLLGEADAVFAVPRRVSLALRAGDRVSLFPMAPVTGRDEGLRWPIAGIAFAPDGRVGTSNEVAAPDGRVALRMDGPGMIGIVPAARLDAAIAALTA